MWTSYKNLNRIEESIAGWNLGNRQKTLPHYVRGNNNEIEYTTKRQPKPKYSEELFNTKAGKIKMVDEGEFGGALFIGGKMVCGGNFSQIFEHNGIKYVIDDLKHMFSMEFRLIQINENGSIEVLYDANKENEKVFGRHCSIGMDAYYIGKDHDGENTIFFLCSGMIFNHSYNGPRNTKVISFLLKYKPGNKEKLFERIDFPDNELDFAGVNSIWSNGEMLAVGCDKQVVIINLSNNKTEYWTELDKESVSKIIEKKRKII